MVMNLNGWLDLSRKVIMTIKPAVLLLASFFAALVSPVFAQDTGRVSPAALPLPLPGTAAMPPDQLRAHNPWNLPMTGVWRFQLTHGQIKAGQFLLGAEARHDVTASTSQTGNSPENAFDGDSDTRWCASSGDYPQWLQADLGETRRVTGIDLVWEFATDRYPCRIEGRNQGGVWKTLADATSSAGLGNGPVVLMPSDVRYIRITVTGNAGQHWASLREVQIQVNENGQDIAWRPAAPEHVDPNVPPATLDAFAGPEYKDTGWHNLPVPSNWEMAGYSLPTYDSVDNTVGLYRRWVAIPSAWNGKSIYWHFDGALDGTEVFVNGVKAGYHESGYTAFDVDLTGLVKPGQRNLFALRVSKMTPSVDCDTGDFQTMGGIYRDTSLIAVPQTHIADITVRTPLSSNYKDATLITLLSIEGAPGQTETVTGSLVRADGRSTGVRLFGSGRISADGTAQIAMNAPVTAPALWSAEKPNLYYVLFSMSNNGTLVERAEQRFGFRQIEIKNNIVLWNGMPIKCTGVCRHDFWADKGFALTEANWVKDLTMMKAANINAIRTSHYNHAQRFLELCDEYGMYILDEVPYCWINDQVKDPAYAPYLLQRAKETLARDKNRPCVLAWSLGNENPNGIDSQEVMNLVKKTDPTRPAFVSGQNPDSIIGQAWEDNHYPGPESIDRFASNPRWGANLSEHPHTFYEKEVQDYDPGASDLWSETLIRTWDKLWKDPTILGSFIWEWQSQGIADKNADTTTDFWYGTDHLRQENNKGIVSAYRVPKPEWWIVKSVYSPVVIEARTVSPSNGSCTVPITNHYSFTDLKEVKCRWTAFKGAAKLDGGDLPIGCAPMQSTVATVPAPDGMTSLRLDFLHPDGSSIIAYNLAVAGVPAPAAPAAFEAGDALTTQDSPQTLLVHNSLQEIAFDKTDGTIKYWRVKGKNRLIGGPILNLGEGKSGNEAGMYRANQPPIVTNANCTAAPEAGGSIRVSVTGTVLSGLGDSALGILNETFDIAADAEMTVTWTLSWTASNINLWEEGLEFTLPETMTRMSWLRDSFFTDYPAGHVGEPSGTAQPGETLFRASKRNLHWLTLTDSHGVGLALLPSDLPLVGRAGATEAGTTLFASREVAGPHGLSGAWVADLAIHAVQGKSLSGSFTLRAIGGQTAASAVGSALGLSGQRDRLNLPNLVEVLASQDGKNWQSLASNIDISDFDQNGQHGGY
jgi:beta-galactosidase